MQLSRSRCKTVFCRNHSEFTRARGSSPEAALPGHLCVVLVDTGSWKSWEPQRELKHFTLLAHPKVNASLLHGFPPTQVSAQPARGFIYGLGCSAVKWLELLASGGHNYPSKLTPIEMNGSTPFSAGVIVAVCLATGSKKRVYLGLQPERLESASPSLFLSFFF